MIKQEIDFIEYATDVSVQATYISDGLIPSSWDILDEDCSDISDWVDYDEGSGVSQVNPAGQFEFDCVASVGDGAARYRDLSVPSKFTLEVKVYFDTLGTKANIDGVRLYYGRTGFYFCMWFFSDGLFIANGQQDDMGNYAEVGTDLVQTGVWQTWKFVVDSTTPASAICDVYLDNVLQASGVDCSNTSNGSLLLIQAYSSTTAIPECHIDYIKIATGLFPSLQCYSEASIKIQGSYSLKVIATITDSLNKTLTQELSPNLNLTDYRIIKLNVRASRIGTNLQFGIHDSGGTTSWFNITINEVDVWHTIRCDISQVTAENKDDVDQIIIKIINADSANIIYIDNIYAENKMGLNQIIES